MTAVVSISRLKRGTGAAACAPPFFFLGFRVPPGDLLWLGERLPDLDRGFPPGDLDGFRPLSLSRRVESLGVFPGLAGAAFCAGPPAPSWENAQLFPRVQECFAQNEHRIVFFFLPPGGGVLLLPFFVTS